MVVRESGITAQRYNSEVKITNCPTHFSYSTVILSLSNKSVLISMSLGSLMHTHSLTWQVPECQHLDITFPRSVLKKVAMYVQYTSRLISKVKQIPFRIPSCMKKNPSRNNTFVAWTRDIRWSKITSGCSQISWSVDSVRLCRTTYQCSMLRPLYQKTFLANNLQTIHNYNLGIKHKTQQCQDAAASN